MNDEPRVVSAQLGHILDVYNQYRESLIRLYERLDIGTCYAGDPAPLVAGLIVAQVVGGIALPVPGGIFDLAEVIGPDGERIMVYATSDRSGLFGGFSAPVESESYDVLGMVAFAHARPVAVHLIPRERLPAVCEYFGQTGGPFGDRMPIAMLTHTHFMVEPVLAAAMGVKTVVLS